MGREGYDQTDDMYKVKSVQTKFRDGFNGPALDTTKWDSVIGSGGTISVSSGTITLGSGTTANAETYILSREMFTVPFKLSFGFTLSQRIANQSFLVECVSVDPKTRIPDGLHCVALLFDGTTATLAKYRVQNGGLTPLDSAATAIPTTASGSYYEIEPFCDEAWFHGGSLDSTNARSNSYRRHQQIPDPNAYYKIRVRWLNGGVSPASNTNAIFQFVACQDYAELTAEITAGRGQSVAGQAIGVQVTNPVAISGNPGTRLSGATISTTASAAITTTTTSADLTVGSYRELQIDVSITAASGTTPTYVLSVERKGSDNIYYPIYSSTSQTGVAKISAAIGAGLEFNKSFGDIVRIVETIGGTTPSFTRSVSIKGK